MKTAKSLYYESFGNGPLVVLLHGYMASGQYWRKTAEDLARNHRVITMDLLGFGKSPKPVTSRYDYAAQMASIDATLAKIGVTEPFILVGHSMGSLLSLRYASANPHRVKKLILTNMPIFLDRISARNVIFSTNIFYRYGLRPGFHSIVWLLFRFATIFKLLPQKIGEGARDRRKYLFQSTGASRLRSLRNVIFAAKIEADLTALQMSTVMLSGMHDRAGYIKDLAKVETIGKNITAFRIAGGHHLPLSQPNLIGQYI